MSRRRLAILRDSRGFTLVELMVAVVILALVLTMAYQFFNFSGTMLKKSDTLADTQNEARLIIQGLRKDFGTALSLGIVSNDPPDDFVIEPGYSLYAVYVNADGQLTRRDSDGPPEAIYSVKAIDYLAIQFSSASPGILHVAVTVEGVIVAETDIYTQNTTVNTTAPDFSASGNLILYQPSG